MAGLTSSPQAENFPIVFKPYNPQSEKLPFQTSDENSYGVRSSLCGRAIERHFTEPGVARKDKRIPFSQDRRAQTGLASQKTRSACTPVSHSGGILRRFLKRNHGNEDSSHSVEARRRQSTSDTKYSESFEQTKSWDQKAILSLGEYGGGIRGYSALLVIQELMKKIRQMEENWPSGNRPWDGPAFSSYHPVDPVQAKSTDSTDDARPEEDFSTPNGSSMFLPCHYFDYMAGTSTGGLISIMLGRLRMNVDDCIKEYETLGGKVFGKSRWFHLRSIPPFWLPREKYNHNRLEGVIQSLVDRRIPKIGGFPGGKTFAFDENRCRVVVVAYQENPGDGSEKTYLFRTYKNLKKASDSILDRNPGPAHDIPILEVARATSAAPGYFKEVKIDGLKYLDGGFGANNPCYEIFSEVRNLNNFDKNCVGCVMSIGTGENKEKRIQQSRTGIREAFRTGLGKFIQYENFARKWASDSNGPHMTMLGQWREHDQSFQYYRLNVDKGLARMKLDEWNCRGATRIALGRCIGWARSRSQTKHHIQRRTDTADNEKCGTISTDDDNPLDHTSSTTHLTNERTATDLDTYIPAFFLPDDKTLTTIRAQTQLYLSKPECKHWLSACAGYLVASRRARVKADPERWEKFCFETWYQCQMRGCARGQKEYPDARAMEKHLLDKHPEEFPRGQGEEGSKKLERTVRGCRVIVH